MSEERKSRYELFLEEEERKALPTKRCSKCKSIKVLTEYYKDSRSRLGVTSRCKVCLGRQRYKDPVDRFWKQFHSHTEKVEDCLEWRGKCDGKGLPRCHWEGKENISLRRVLYRLSSGEIPEGSKVITTCRNRRCVRQSHLQLVTAEEFDTIWRNSAAAGEHHGLYKHPERRPRGETHGNAVLTEGTVLAIRERYARGDLTLAEVGNQFGINQSHVSSIVRGDVWKHVGGACGGLPMSRLIQGERNVHAKLMEYDVRRIRAMHSDGMPVRQIAHTFGVGNTTIRHVIAGETWKHVQ